MYKVFLLFKRRQGLSSADLTRIWLQAPSPDVGSLTGLVAHVHNRGTAGDMPIENAPSAAFDGADELWFADASAALDFFAGPEFRQGWMGRYRELLAEPPQVIGGTPQLLWQREETPSPDRVKIITLPSRPAGMTNEAFGDHWVNVHFLELAMGSPTARERLDRYEVCIRNDEPSFGFNVAAFDGAGTIEFVSAEALQAEFASKHYREVMAPDEPRFTDPSRSAALMVEPFILKG